MDEVKDKMKGFMKKVNTSISSPSSGRFSGQGRVLGTASSGGGGSGTASGPTRPGNGHALVPGSTASPGQSGSIPTRPGLAADPNKPRVATASPNPATPPPPPPPRTTNPDPALGGRTSDPPLSNLSLGLSGGRVNPSPVSNPSGGFDPFGALITTGKRNIHGYDLQVLECPLCGSGFGSEAEVTDHVESCLNAAERNVVRASKENDLDGFVSRYVSGNPKNECVEILVKVLGNVGREPKNAKFRKIRLGNPKIKEAIADVAGGLDVLEFVGFELKEENGEMWAVMDVPTEEQIGLLKMAILLLEPPKVVESLPPEPQPKLEEEGEIKEIDREMRVFCPAPESEAAKVELPDSFYNLSAEEVKREAEMRRKKIAESQLLVPKSYKEKQAKAGRKRYSKTVIRVQFPDGLMLQGVFSPKEPTTALYEFVSSALKDPSLEFELVHLVVIRRGVIPHLPAAGEIARTLEEEDLVPSAVVKFRPLETDSVVFNGLSNKLLEVMEPLSSASV